jgi:hypothetical protein
MQEYLGRQQQSDTIVHSACAKVVSHLVIIQFHLGLLKYCIMGANAVSD